MEVHDSAQQADASHLPETSPPAPTCQQEAPEVFISSRFSESKEHASSIKKSLEKLGVNVFLCDVPPGGDVASAIIDALASSSLAVIMGTKTFGLKTDSGFSTHEELRYIVNHKKPFFLVKMCAQFEVEETKFRLPPDVSYFPWFPESITTPAPEELIWQIFGKLRSIKPSPSPSDQGEEGSSSSKQGSNDTRLILKQLAEMNQKMLAMSLKMERLETMTQQSCLLPSWFVEQLQTICNRSVFISCLDTSFGVDLIHRSQPAGGYKHLALGYCDQRYLLSVIARVTFETLSVSLIDSTVGLLPKLTMHLKEKRGISVLLGSPPPADNDWDFSFSQTSAFSFSRPSDSSFSRTSAFSSSQPSAEEKRWKISWIASKRGPGVMVLEQNLYRNGTFHSLNSPNEAGLIQSTSSNSWVEQLSKANPSLTKTGIIRPRKDPHISSTVHSDTLIPAPSQPETTSLLQVLSDNTITLQLYEFTAKGALPMLQLHAAGVKFNTVSADGTVRMREMQLS